MLLCPCGAPTATPVTACFTAESLHLQNSSCKSNASLDCEISGANDKTHHPGIDTQGMTVYMLNCAGLHADILQQDTLVFCQQHVKMPSAWVLSGHGRSASQRACRTKSHASTEPVLRWFTLCFLLNPKTRKMGPSWRFTRAMISACLCLSLRTLLQHCLTPSWCTQVPCGFLTV